ncbi:MAG TPA: PhoH family protein [Chthoniobacterales bacterium]
MDYNSGSTNGQNGDLHLEVLPQPERQIITSPARVKNFVLDTNVLLHDPNSIHRFDDNHVWIPVEVLTELDKFKNEQSERGANARIVHRSLSKIFGNNRPAVVKGARLPGGGSIRIAVNERATVKPTGKLKRFQALFPETASIDNRIIASCLEIERRCDDRTVLVTKDINMLLKALAIGLEAEDYLNDKVESGEVESDLRVIHVAPHELQRFGSSRVLTIEDSRAHELLLNEYALLTVDGQKSLPARYVGEGIFRRLNIPAALDIPKGITLKPANAGQQCFLDALLDPTISLVTCYGQAGTGKTLLAVAAGLYALFSRDYNGMTVSRPVVAMGNTLGFLPGTLDEKMRPWLQSIYDAFDVLLPIRTPQGEGKAGKRKRIIESVAELSPGPAQMRPYEKLIEQGLVEIEALCYIRGRSIPNRFFVLDEAQQLTPLEAKTVVTRMSRGSKLVMVGDPAQIDHPYVDSRSNGLVYTRDRLKGQGITAHVTLSKGERSSLAEIGATLM